MALGACTLRNQLRWAVITGQPLHLRGGHPEAVKRQAPTNPMGNLARHRVTTALRQSLPIDETACGLESRRHTGDFYLVARLTKRAIATPQERSVAPRFGPSRGASHDPLRCRGPKNRMALRPPITSGSSLFVGIPPSTKIGSQTYTRDGPLQGGAGDTGGHRVGRR